MNTEHFEERCGHGKYAQNSQKMFNCTVSISTRPQAVYIHLSTVDQLQLNSSDID